MSSDGYIRPNEQISEEAAEWLIEFRTGDIDAAGRLAFDTWVRASPEHLRAFIEMAVLWQDAGQVDAQRKLDVESLIIRSRAESNVVTLSPNASPHAASLSSDFGEGPLNNARPPQFSSPTLPHTRDRREFWKLCTAAAVILTFVGGALTTWTLFRSHPAYVTDAGEQRSIRLQDGSTVVLNSRSKVRVDFNDSRRTVALLQGQALFRVARDPVRPFVVSSDGTSVKAVGTEFDVNRSHGGTIVTVVEGKVAVVASATDVQAQASGSSFPGAGGLALNASGSVASHEAIQSTAGRQPSDDAPIFLSAGEQLKVMTGAPFQPTHTNVSSATAWTQGQVVLQSASLAEVADEFNRYSSRKLVVEDNGKTPLHLSGIFATDPDFLVRYLRSRPDVEVRETRTEIDIIRNDPR
jgi:transmembrane sensor